MFENLRQNEPELDGRAELLAAYSQRVDGQAGELDLTIAPGGVHEQAPSQPEVAPIVASEGRGPREVGRIGTWKYVARDLPTPAADAQQGKLPGSSLETAGSFRNDMLKFRPGVAEQLEADYQRLRAELYGDQA